MKKRIQIIFFGLVAGGVSYWFNSYGQLFILGINIYVVMSTLAFIGTFLSSRLMKLDGYKAAVPFASGIILAVLLRIIYEVTFWDSTSHNLAPFEILIAGLVAFPSSFIGVYLYRTLLKFKH